MPTSPCLHGLTVLIGSGACSAIGHIQGGSGGLMRRHELVRDKLVLCLEHLAGKVVHDGLGCEMEIAEHFVRPPATQEANDIGVNVGDKQSRGACRPEAEGACRDFRR